jgi:IS30 family transposase
MVALQNREDLRSAEYLADRLGKHPKTIARWIREGKIEPDEYHRRWNGAGKPEMLVGLFRESTVERLIEEFKDDPQEI